MMVAYFIPLGTFFQIGARKHQLWEKNVPGAVSLLTTPVTPRGSAADSEAVLVRPPPPSGLFLEEWNFCWGTKEQSKKHFLGLCYREKKRTRTADPMAFDKLKGVRPMEIYAGGRELFDL